jgi:hypothetical protein
MWVMIYRLNSPATRYEKRDTRYCFVQSWRVPCIYVSARIILCLSRDKRSRPNGNGRGKHYRFQSKSSIAYPSNVLYPRRLIQDVYSTDPCTGSRWRLVPCIHCHASFFIPARWDHVQLLRTTLLICAFPVQATSAPYFVELYNLSPTSPHPGITYPLSVNSSSTAAK